MKARLANLWAHHRLLLIAFSVAALLTVLFAIRTVAFTIYWSNPAHRNQALKGWMTPHYIAYSYDLDANAVGAFLKVGQVGGFHPSLLKIARARGIPLNTLKAQLARWIKSQHRAPG